MPIRDTHTIDAVVTELRVIFTTTGPQLGLKYIERETNAAGRLIRQDSESETPLTVDDGDPADQEVLKAMSVDIGQRWVREWSTATRRAVPTEMRYVFTDAAVQATLKIVQQFADADGHFQSVPESEIVVPPDYQVPQIAPKAIAVAWKQRRYG